MLRVLRMARMLCGSGLVSSAGTSPRVFCDGACGDHSGWVVRYWVAAVSSQSVKQD